MLVSFLHFFSDHACVCRWVYAKEYMQRWEERALDPLELELQAVGSCLVWILGTELGSSTRSARPSNY